MDPQKKYIFIACPYDLLNKVEIISVYVCLCATAVHRLHSVLLANLVAWQQIATSQADTKYFKLFHQRATPQQQLNSAEADRDNLEHRNNSDRNSNFNTQRNAETVT